MNKLYSIAIIAIFAVGCSSADKKAIDTNPTDMQKQKQQQAQMDSQKKLLDSLKCSLKDDVRIVELSKVNNVKLCEVHYTKSGDKERIASAERQKNYCDGVLSKVKSNLETAGFKCSL